MQPDSLQELYSALYKTADDLHCNFVVELGTHKIFILVPTGREEQGSNDCVFL